MLFRIIIASFILFLSLSSRAISFKPNADSLILKDSTANQATELIHGIAENEKKQSQSNYRSHAERLAQSKKFVELYSEMQSARNFLKEGFEYKKVMELISTVASWKETAVDGVITHTDSLQTARNLTATSILLKELVSRTDKWLVNILKYHNSLGIHQYRLDSLATDSLLYQVPKDSSEITAYYQKLLQLKNGLDPLNAAIKGALDSIQRIEVQVSLLKTSLESDIAETESLRKLMDEHVGERELESFSKTASRQKTFSGIITYASAKAELLIVFYIANHLFLILLMLVSAFGLALYIRLLIRRSRKANIFNQLKERTQLFTYPDASALLISVTIFQFFLPLPPFIITSIIWLVCSLALTIILWKSLSSHWFRAWLIFYLLFIISLIHNFILTQSAGERWMILFFSAAGIIAGMYFLLSRKSRQSDEKIIFVLLIILVGYQIGSIYFNLHGNYNQAKALMTNGYFTLVVALMLLWTIRLGRDSLNISRFFHRSAEDDRHQMPIQKINGKLPRYLYLLLFVGWFILLSRNTHAYQSMFGPLEEAFRETRSIGKFEFTYGSVFIFFLVIFLSGIITKVVSFLTADATPVTGSASEKGPGSWLLLIRIAIISAGVLLAFVAAGIPMDRLAVIIGALSVGIGFGLQTLINNLVSGLIIAFEKPINVGDIVEVAGSIGRMKSIGIRSSVISTWDGSEVIIPNGDLLSQHLVNWTMGNTKRRFEIPVGVAYGTNLEETRKLLQDLMLTDDRILKYPEPFVLVTSFNSSSIDFVLKFWVAHFSIGFDVKSDLMVAIDNLFKEHNIVIPFPQQDVHLKSGGTSARKDEKQNPNEKDKSGFEEDVNKEKSNEIQTNSSQDLQDFRKE